MIDKIKDFIEGIKNDIEWILMGCPKPIPIEVESKERKDGRKVRPKN